MPKLKVLSGQEIISFLKQFSFVIDRQKGSHVNLSRNTISGKQNATIPNHKEISRGTLRTIYKQLSKYIPEDDLRKFFWTE
ncbi:MAG: type II toxin-antitoxin system HicA family toxin [Candidatus Paceibacterota bacterium]